MVPIGNPEKSVTNHLMRPWTSWSFKMGPIGSPETSASSYLNLSLKMELMGSPETSASSHLTCSWTVLLLKVAPIGIPETSVTNYLTRPWTAWPLKMGLIGSPETSVSNHLPPRNIPENGRILFNGGGSMRWRVPAPSGSTTRNTRRLHYESLVRRLASGRCNSLAIIARPCLPSGYGNTLFAKQAPFYRSNLLPPFWL
jgi:hypothetical protein